MGTYYMCDTLFNFEDTMANLVVRFSLSLPLSYNEQVNMQIYTIWGGDTYYVGK